MNLLRIYFIKTFSLDLRALALFRIGTGILILTDLYTRATDLEAHYANTGVLPLSILFEYSWNPYFFSFHTGSGLWQVQGFYFLLAAIFAICLTLGFKTRLASSLSWIFLLSLQNRNPMILQGGDDLLRMLLFWGIFLPWNRFYSLDGKNSNHQETTVYFSAATVALVLQIFLVYFCTALLKNAPEWGETGTAIYYALSLDQILLPGGRLLYPQYELLKFLTFAVYYCELLLPFLLLIPFRNAFFRMVVILAFFGLHIGISLTLFVGLFYLINLVSLLSLLPPNVMYWLEKKLLLPLSPWHDRVSGFFTPKTYPFQADLSLQFQFSTNLTRSLSRLREGAVATLLLYVIWWNLDNTPQKFFPMPEMLRWPGYVLRTDQNWGMFAPSVFKDDGWYILEGTTQNNKKIDLNRHGEPVTYKKPKAIVDLFKNDRWRKYSENYLFVSNAWMRTCYCDYLLRTWNENNAAENQLKDLDVIYMKEVSLPDYKTEPVKREVLCNCQTAM